MDLAELKFVVDTKQLETAATRVAELGTAVSKLNKPMQDLTKESTKNNKELSKAEEAAAKAALAQLKLQQAQEKSNTTSKDSVSVLERQTMILDYMAQGFSKGQSSIMATYKASGALDDAMMQLGNTLKTQRSLIGGDAFDKSIGLMQKLQNETRITAEVNNLFNRNLGLTEKQMIELAREKERLIALYNLEGKSLDGLAAEYDQIVRTSSELNHLNDARTKSMRDQVKAQNDSAKANSYVAGEMERVNRLTQSGGDITSATNNKLMKFEAALKQTGMSAADQTSKLEAYKQALLSVQKAAGNRQVDYLSRALGPQITDIAVGLATGQSPMMVLLQQGGQLRDQFALAGVAGKDMGDMLTKATLGMVSSVKDVAVAVGGAMVGAFSAAGKASLNFIGDITGVNSSIILFKKYLVETHGFASRDWLRMLDNVGSAMSMLAGIGVAAAIAALVAFGIAIKENIKLESELSKSLNLTGASLGLTKDNALALANQLSGGKDTTGKYVEAITAIAKEGGVTSDNLKVVAKTIGDVSKVTGISADTLAKNFSKISEKPLEGLIPLAKELGTIDVAMLKHIQKLELAGKHADAAKIATNAYAGALNSAKNKIVSEMGYIEDFFYHVAAGANIVLKTIMSWGAAVPVVKKLAKAQEELAVLQAGEKNANGDYRNPARAEAIKTKEKEIQLYKDQIKADDALAATRKKNSGDASDLDKKLKEQGGANFKVPEDAYLKRLQEEYKDNNKEIDSESKKLLAQNKANYDLGLIDIGAFLSEETRLIQDQNKQKIDVNDNYLKALDVARVTQIKAINEMTAKESVKNKTVEDAKKLDEQRIAQIKAVNEQYAALTAGVRSNTEVLKDKSAEEQAKSIARLGEQTKKVIEGSKEFVTSQDDIIAKRAIAVELEKQTAGLFGAEAARIRAQIEMQQSHITKLSELEVAAAKARVALQELNGMSSTDPEYLRAKESVANAEKALTDAKVKSQTASEKAGFDAVQKYQDVSTQRLNAYGQSFEKMFSGMADAIVEFAKTGKLNFSDLVNSMLSDILRFEAKRMTMAAYEGMGGAAGIFKMFGGSSGTTLSQYDYAVQSGFANGGAFNNGIQAFANGGAFTNSIVSEPTLFKFAKGTGLMGEAGPEAIMPLRRGSDGSLGVAASGASGGNVSVQVINNSNAQATTQETTDSKGNRKIEVIIGDMTAGEISRSGSASQKSIKSTFGLQPQLIRR